MYFNNNDDSGNGPDSEAYTEYFAQTMVMMKRLQRKFEISGALYLKVAFNEVTQQDEPIFLTMEDTSFGFTFQHNN